MAEGLTQAPGQQLAVVALPYAVPVSVDDGEAALQRHPLLGGEPGLAVNRGGRPRRSASLCHPGEDGDQQDGGDDDHRQPGRDLRRPSGPGAAANLYVPLPPQVRQLALTMLQQVTGPGGTHLPS